MHDLRAAAPEPAPAAEVIGLTKRFGPTLAVDDVSFTVRSRSITGCFGPNGAGKTTTLRALLGLVEPTAGKAHIAGASMRELREPWRHVGAVLESNDLHPRRTARDHLRALARLCEIGDDHVDDVLALVGLAEAADRQAGGYSLGMRQRLGLASALLGDPALLVLDEPANGLDPAGVHWLRSLLRAFADAGGAVLMSSHLLAEAEHTVDRVLVISGGRLLADMPIETFAGGPGGLEAAYLALVSATGAPGAVGTGGALGTAGAVGAELRA